MIESTTFIPVWSVPLLLIILALLWAWALMPNDTDSEPDDYPIEDRKRVSRRRRPLWADEEER